MRRLFSWFGFDPQWLLVRDIFDCRRYDLSTVYTLVDRSNTRTPMMDYCAQTGRLTLQLEKDDDGTGELTAVFSANGFAGKGSAWFSVSDLARLAKELNKFPLPKSQPVKLEGGYFRSDAPGTLKQEHLHISVYPIGSLGAVGVHVRAATEYDSHDRPETRHFVGVEIKTSYSELERFSKKLFALVRGDCDAATLNEDRQSS